MRICTLNYLCINFLSNGKLLIHMLHQKLESKLLCTCSCMLSSFSCVWLFVTPWTVAHQASLSKGFSRQKYWSELPCPPPGYLPDPRVEPASPVLPAFQADSLQLNHLGRPKNSYTSEWYSYFRIFNSSNSNFIFFFIASHYSTK